MSYDTIDKRHQRFEKETNRTIDSKIYEKAYYDELVVVMADQKRKAGRANAIAATEEVERRMLHWAKEAELPAHAKMSDNLLDLRLGYVLISLWRIGK